MRKGSNITVCGTVKHATIKELETLTTMAWEHKDLALALEFAERLDLGLPLTGLTNQLLKAMGLGKIG